MRRRTYSLAFALFLIALLTAQTIQADLTNNNDVHMDNNSEWSAWIGGGNVGRTCKPCHALWNVSTTQSASEWDAWFDADGFVINNPARTLNNCVDCHTYMNSAGMSSKYDSSIPTMLANSVHGSLEAKCLSCHTIYHSGHQTIRSETVGSTTYTGCDSGCHTIAVSLEDKAAGNAVTDGDIAFMRIYTINSTVVPAYKPVLPSSSTSVTTSYYPTSYNLVEGTLSSGSVSNLQNNDESYMTFQAAGVGSQTVLTIQPSNADARVDEGNPDTNYGSETFIGTQSDRRNIDRSFISFDISSIPSGVQIDSAILSLYLYSGAGSGRTLDVYKVISSWTEGGVTFNTAPTVAALATDSQTVLASNGWMNWTVTSDVSAWYGGETNFGFRLSDAAEQSGKQTVLFYSKEYSSDTSLRPRLIVTYTSIERYSAVVELTGTSNSNTFTQLVWSIDSALNTSSVPVTLQLYDYNSSAYPTSGTGYWAYTSSSTPNTDESHTETITSSPESFKNSASNWKIRINATLGSPTPFDLKVDWVEYKPTYYPSVETFIRKLFNSSSANPFGEQKQNLYLAYLDPWNMDPSLISATERFKVCFNCHFITKNPAQAAAYSENPEAQYIPIPEEVFSIISNPHSIGKLREYNLDDEDLSIERRGEKMQLTLIIPFIAVAIIVLILVSFRR